VAQVGITLHYLAEVIQERYGEGENVGLELRYFLEEEPLGTAGSVKNAADFLDQTFLVISGDALTDFDLRPAVKVHREKKPWPPWCSLR